MKHFKKILVWLWLGMVVCLGTNPAGATPTATIFYTTTNDLFPNPERGFYHHHETHSDSYVPLDLPTLQGYLTDNISLTLCLFYLDDFVSQPISAGYLSLMQTDFDTVRTAGLKCIVRLAYTNQTNGWPPTPPYGDATKAQMLAHLDQLQPYFQANEDVIAVVQAGFIGIWGEWYYTDYFGDPLLGPPTATDYANRGEVLAKLLDVLPAGRMAQLRTPLNKQQIYGTTTPLSLAQAYDGSDIARTGHHNDCFLASADDFGTYADPINEYPYLATETNYVPMGGETCNPNPPRSQCPTALSEMALFHWSYINADYHSTVLSSWVTDGCMDEITRRLGYRLSLTQGTYSDSASPGGAFQYNIALQNDGFAAPFNPRSVELVFRHSSNAEVVMPLSDDPRLWPAGTSQVLSGTITLPAGMLTGTYQLFLHLPDPQPSLQARPEYAIRLANSGTWESNTGYNNLLHTLTVNAPTAILGEQITIGPKSFGLWLLALLAAGLLIGTLGLLRPGSPTLSKWLTTTKINIGG